MTRPLTLALAVLACSGASAQHVHPDGTRHVHEAAPTADSVSTFLATGLRVDEAAPPPGSALGRAGLRYGDGGYVSVVFGRPFVRGRQIFGGLVGYGEVWSAGAHQATELWTTVPLVVGGTRIEPGAYSLFVTPRPDRWTIHVNRRLGMHLADEYDPTDDVVTVEVTPETLGAPVQALTWAFAPDSSSLTLAWDRTRVALPITRADR